jgi:glycosyltransferase involved in cell wall biosynthesis
MVATIAREMTNNQERRGLSILFIVPSDYDSLLKKGVASMILERDERGFFKKVFNIHPYASKTQTLELNNTHQLIEFGPNYPFSSLNFRLGKLTNYISKPLLVTKSLIQLVRWEHIDLIRATDPFLCGFYAWVVSRFTGVPFCVSVHTDYDKTYRLSGRKRGTPFLFKILERFVLPRAELVMPIREHIVQELLRKGANPNRIRVIPHGISIEEFSFPENKDIFRRYRIPQEKKVISFVGRLAKDNYVYDIIELARRIYEMRNDFVVLLIGDGAERDELKSLVHEYGLSSIVMFTGFQPREIAISVRRKSLMALCLKGGFSLIESCLAGCPPISYDIEWHYELVKNGETGFLIKEANLDALTEAVIYLLNHPEKAREMGARAREIAIAKHDISHTSEVKRNCYRKLLQCKVSRW